MLKSLLAVPLLVAECIPTVAVPQMPRPVTSKAPAAPTLASIMDSHLTFLESQLVPAAEAMPGDKYSFATEDPASLKTANIRVGIQACTLEALLKGWTHE